MLIGLCSVKGSPGVTTAALALAACWPAGEPVVVEADPAGGDLAARFRLPVSPGLVSLAAEARRNPSPELVVSHSQLLPPDLRVVVGPVSDEQAHAALEVLGGRGHEVLRSAVGRPDSAVIVDMGRIRSSSPVLPLLRGADAIVLLARPRPDELTHVASLLDVVPSWTRAPSLVLVGDGHPRSEVEQALHVPVLGVLPDDPGTASVLCGRPGKRRLHRTALGRAAGRLARVVVEVVTARQAAPPGDGLLPLPIVDGAASAEQSGRSA